MKRRNLIIYFTLTNSGTTEFLTFFKFMTFLILLNLRFFIKFMKFKFFEIYENFNEIFKILEFSNSGTTKIFYSFEIFQYLEQLNF